MLAGSDAAPELTGLAAPWWPPAPARVLDLDGPGTDWAPAEWPRMGTELAVAPMGGYALLVGRPALRWRPAELARLMHLAGIAASVTATVQA